MQKRVIFFSLCLLFTFVVGLISVNTKGNFAITTSVENLSNKKIGWGLKRAQNHEQPDLGSENKKLIDSYEGMAMGNSQDKFVYLTFDYGYEAGYTEKILEVLKNNNVKACFFITAHYLNTQSDLVKQMVNEGHIIRKSYSKP